MLRELYARHPMSQCVDQFNQAFGLNLTVLQMRSAARNHNITCDRSGCFQKGNVSWNKGRRMPKSFQSVETQFKRGEMPHNYLPVGSERISRDGYIEVKVADPKTWRAKHRLVWEAANGPIPKGYAVIFMDQNKTNIALDNLRLISRKYLAVANRMGLLTQSAELTETGLLVARVKIATGEAKARAKRRKGNEHQKAYHPDDR